ncbi:oxidoreductase, 2OG-Fe(II) oxygenase family [Synechococcus sp. PCC 7335]|uniref:Fe2+-dependent dioxygenase n=1 Tax=Synechococcus sp. (strain ATCC 29403 / PCC 7335) TaxID=91464 RepID=UPI00017ECB19|nr:Fe2+-dependent dioxygenase [Synechococcus sp. PCC 7335]EDX86272.1 oxidoreductase, 2OG-Fe(II) oxygenase family [Synechococcus sp. PCC 7335]
MIVCIPDLLASEELDHLEKALSVAEFADGRLTAGWHAKLVKQNQQLTKTPDTDALKDLVRKALQRNQLFQAVARPRAIHSLLISRYQEGMSYGRHVDNALMKAGGFLRSDLSFTIFLNSPDTYEGGELVIEGADSETPYKLAAGSAIVYPSTSLHRVDPVTSGERLVVVGWVQSLIRQAEKREILFDLVTAQRSLFAKEGKTDEFDLLSKSIANLLRMWAE